MIAYKVLYYDKKNRKRYSFLKGLTNASGLLIGNPLSNPLFHKKKIMNYRINNRTTRKKGFGPLACFCSKIDAVEFIEGESILRGLSQDLDLLLEKGFCFEVWECDVIKNRSKQRVLWFLDENHEKKSSFILPYGTVLVISLKPIKKVYTWPQK